LGISRCSVRNRAGGDPLTREAQDPPGNDVALHL
jgi:hypothetical protein